METARGHRAVRKEIAFASDRADYAPASAARRQTRSLIRLRRQAFSTQLSLRRPERLISGVRSVSGLPRWRAWKPECRIKLRCQHLLWQPSHLPASNQSDFSAIGLRFSGPVFTTIPPNGSRLSQSEPATTHSVLLPDCPQNNRRQWRLLQ